MWASTNETADAFRLLLLDQGNLGGAAPNNGATVTKGECEKAIRQLCREWVRSLSSAQHEHPSFLEFKLWLCERGYSRYLKFRSTVGAEYQAEMWFDDELKQRWRR